MKKWFVILSVGIGLIGCASLSQLTQPKFEPYGIETPRPVLPSDLKYSDQIINLTDRDISEKLQKGEYKKIGIITQKKTYRNQESLNDIKKLAKENHGDVIFWHEGVGEEFGITAEVWQLK